jgi:hypothetical protein
LSDWKQIPPSPKVPLAHGVQPVIPAAAAPLTEQAAIGTNDHISFRYDDADKMSEASTVVPPKATMLLPMAIIVAAMDGRGRPQEDAAGSSNSSHVLDGMS